MFWECFGRIRMMDLTNLFGDSENKKNGVIVRIILEFALKKFLLQILDENPEFIFMQDECHDLYYARVCVKTRGVPRAEG
jgi:hypothetical protein